MISESRNYEAFAAVVEARSISASARRLGIPRPTIGRRLRRLEEELGVQLLLRSTRKVVPTPAGERLYARVRPLLDAFRAAERDLLDEAAEPRGVLRVSVPPLIAPTLAPVCAHLHACHPLLTIDVSGTLRLVELDEDGYEVALRTGSPRDASVVSKRLFPSRVSAVASPAYLACAQSLVDEDDLVKHALLLGHTADGRPRRFWPRLAGDRIAVNGRFIAGDRTLLKAMALAGRGIALLSAVNCQDAIDGGRLVRVLDDIIGTEVSLSVVYARRSFVPPRVRVFVDAVVQHFAVTAA